MIELKHLCNRLFCHFCFFMFFLRSKIWWLAQNHTSRIMCYRFSFRRMRKTSLRVLKLHLIIPAPEIISQYYITFDDRILNYRNFHRFSAVQISRVLTAKSTVGPDKRFEGTLMNNHEKTSIGDRTRQNYHSERFLSTANTFIQDVVRQLLCTMTNWTLILLRNLWKSHQFRWLFQIIVAWLSSRPITIEDLARQRWEKF